MVAGLADFEALLVGEARFLVPRRLVSLLVDVLLVGLREVPLDVRLRVHEGDGLVELAEAGLVDRLLVGLHWRKLVE